MARVKRLVDAFPTDPGPLAFSSDCTKVRQHVSYSTDFGSYILGSTLPLDDCKVSSSNDIDRIVARIQDEKAYAKQCRAILAKVWLAATRP